MNKKRMLGAIITIAFVGIGIYFLFKNIELKKVEDEYQDYIPQEEISDENNQQTKIILYFKNENDELENEIRVINANILLKEPEKQLINYLIKGPQNNNLQKLIPDGTRLNEIKIEKNCAIINFSNEILNYKDENEKLNLSLMDIKGEILSISQFTLYANCKKGRRPSFLDAAKPEISKPLYEYFNKALENAGVHTETGIFGAMMKVSLINDGPTTIILDSKEIIQS